jgi:hypothetical protein
LGRSIEDSLAGIDSDTLELLESGKVDISQIGLEDRADCLLSFQDICRLNVAIFESPSPPAAASVQQPWTVWRDRPAVRPWRLEDGDSWSDSAVVTPDEDSLNFAGALLSTSSSSVVLRESVINSCGRGGPPAEDISLSNAAGEAARTGISPPSTSPSPPSAASPSASAAAVAEISPATPAKYSKEIDQKESPKLVVLIDTRFMREEDQAEANVDNDDDKEEDEGQTLPISEVPPWYQPEPISPILGIKPFLATPTIFSPPNIEREPGEASSAGVEEPLNGSPLLKAAAVPHIEVGSGLPLPLAAVSNSTFNDDEGQRPAADKSRLSEEDIVSSPPAPTLAIVTTESPVVERPVEDCPPTGRLRSILRGKSRSLPVSFGVQPEGGKKSIKFTEKTIFYFGRQQGWVSVPRDGGSTLGNASLYLTVPCASTYLLI